ncbi:hypothetical protein BDA96_05G152000 [Sorghum bicolor]|uniref:Uncharacterized protein n=2 Tax=Sorghum bicolor TaxID=4558 RepID=A0A921QZE1_SORBI|nr:hypothetical protein BDA96_05G152000 [Sorghum bicolor]KXG28563.1 hypothetical protein SORBI_3005G138100 [Sorghum bicolor]
MPCISKVGWRRRRAPLMCRAGQPWRPGKPRRPEHADVWGFGLQQQPSVI